MNLSDAALGEPLVPAPAPNGDGSPAESAAKAVPVGDEAPPGAAAVAVPLDLEQRVRRLEEGMAQLEQLRRPVPVAVALPAPVNSPASRPSQAGLMIEAGRRLFGGDSAAPAVVVPFRAEVRRPFLVEVWAETRAILRMYVDPRHRLSWTGRVVPAGLLILILTSAWWFPLSWFTILGIGSFVDKTLDLGLAYFLCKVVGNEARKYRQTSPDLPPSLRL